MIEYNLSAVRSLLTDAFTARDLWRFCQDRPAFRPILADFGYNASLGEMIDVLIEYCRTKLLFADLLSAIEEINPNQYERYHEQLYMPTSDTPAGQMAESLPVYHNLPQPDYVRFVGREKELTRVYELLSPANRTWVVTIDGIGGIGKSALALEVAHHYLHEYEQLPPEERFEAIIWTSAKALVLTADGIAPRQQITRTLDDIYTTIAVTLEREDVTRTRPEEQGELVTKALTRQRTLLIVDNLETVDDERVNAFLRELPAPTKAIVTTRHRVDVAYPVRLTGMPQADGLALIALECDKKGVMLTKAEAEKVYNRTGGVPLAIVWSVAQIAFGYGTAAVLRRLGSPTSDVARYCLEATLGCIRDKSAHELLLSLSFFGTQASREALGFVANLPELDRDEGLVELERFSLLNKLDDQFSLLPLTRSYLLSDIMQIPDKGEQIGKRWIEFFRKMRHQGLDEAFYWFGYDYKLLTDGHLLPAVIEWAYEHESSDDVFALTFMAFWYWDITGHWSEIIAWGQKALELAKTVNDLQTVVHLSGYVGWVCRQWEDYTTADTLYQEGLSIAMKHGWRKDACVILQLMADIPRKLKQFDKARQLSDEAWALAQELDIADLCALVYMQYGKLARDLGDWDSARHYFSKVREWAEQGTQKVPRDEELARGSWSQLAWVAHQQGRLEEARSLYLHSIDFFRERGTRGHLATLQFRLALVEYELGNSDAASSHVVRAAYWFDRLGMQSDYEDAQALLERLD